MWLNHIIVSIPYVYKIVTFLTLLCTVSGMTVYKHRPPINQTTSRETRSQKGLFWRTGYICAKYKWITLVAWIIILTGVTVGSSTLNGLYNAQFSLPHASSQIGANLLRQHTNQPIQNTSTPTGSVVFHIPSGDLHAHAADIETAVSSIRRLNTIKAVSSPFESLSPDNRVATADITYRDNVTSLANPDVTAIDTAVHSVRADGVLVDYTGDLGSTASSPSSNANSELVGVMVALIILLLAFGSVLATLIPILSAVIGVFSGIGLLGVLSAYFKFPSESPTLALMMGLGVGIDYALFLSTRFRQYIIDGDDPLQAVAKTVASSGRAVVIAASTVVIALIGLYASGITFIGQLGVSASITVAIAALAAITLVPALLGIAGRHIDHLKVRRHPIAEPAHKKTQWHRFANTLSRHPVAYLCSALVLLIILALPVFKIQIGNPGVRALPTHSTERRASDAIDQGFGVGYQASLTTVIQLTPGQSNAQIQTLASNLHSQLAHTAGIASATPFVASKDHAILMSTLIPTTRPTDKATASLIQGLTNQDLPSIVGSKGTAYITGGTATSIALQHAVSASLPIIIATVVVAAMLLILLSFRSPFLALKAGIVNLISIGASYGILVAVFQWGWASSLLGVPNPVPIVSYVPMLLFAIIFGLSMDYEVFLLSRVRESYHRGDSNKASVAYGLSVTGRIISCAALIMACVFFSFILSPSITIKMLAFGLGISVIIDATIVRLVIVPCAMFIFERANWWIPGWLDRLLPHLDP